MKNIEILNEYKFLSIFTVMKPSNIITNHLTLDNNIRYQLLNVMPEANFTELRKSPLFIPKKLNKAEVDYLNRCVILLNVEKRYLN